MKLTVIKIGGKLIENDTILQTLCDKLSAYYPNCVLVHGGGSMAGQLSLKLGIEPRMYEGRRITDKATLDVTIMAYAGLANKKIVACLQSKGVKACGLSGCDMGVILSHKRAVKDIDWGFVGDVDSVNAESLTLLLENRVMPVVSPITCDAAGQLLNTNADSVASAVAQAMSKKYEVELVYCFDKPGVLTDINDDSSVIATISQDDYKTYLEKGSIHSGMIPKLDNAFKTIASGVKSVRLTSPEALDKGTLIV